MIICKRIVLAPECLPPLWGPYHKSSDALISTLIVASNLTSAQSIDLVKVPILCIDFLNANTQIVKEFTRRDTQGSSGNIILEVTPCMPAGQILSIHFVFGSALTLFDVRCCPANRGVAQ
jgi:hypothetical protein